MSGAVGAPSAPPSGQVSSSLIVPLVMWGSKPPPLRVSVVRFLSQSHLLVTGTQEGVIILWRCAGDGVRPQQMLTGHTQAITALSSASLSPKSTRFVSASADGEVCLWDYQDGRVVDSVPGQLVHTHIQPFWRKNGEIRSSILLCCGEYNDLIVLDANDVTPLFCLFSRVEPDWCCSFVLVKRPGKPVECIGISLAGMIKLWPLVQFDKKDMNKPVYEEESKRLLLTHVKSLSFHPASPDLLLVVCEHSWMVIHLDDLSVLCTVESGEESLVTGQLVDGEKAAIAGRNLSIFQLPASVLSRTGNCSEDGNGDFPKELARLDAPAAPIHKEWLDEIAWCVWCAPSGDWLSARACAVPECSLLIWALPKYDSDFIGKLASLPNLPLRYRGTYEQSLGSYWNSLKYEDESNFPNLGDEHVTSSLYLGGAGKLILGMRDGFLVVRYIAEAISSAFLASSSSQSSARSGARAIRAHRSSIGCLLHPHSIHPRFDSHLVLSGGDDFAVCLWNITTLSRVFRFCANGGSVSRFIVPPDSTTKVLGKVVASVGEDHSVALLNVRDCRVVLLATRHPSPVTDIRFRPADDYMLVRTGDGDVYVWQIETGSLERVVSGMVAEDILSAAEEAALQKERRDDSGATHATKLVRAIRHRNVHAMRKLGGVGVSGAESESTPREESERGSAGVGAVSVTSLVPAASSASSSPHLVLFDVSSLISALLAADATENSVEKDGKTPERKDSQGLLAQLSAQLESNLAGDVARVVVSLIHAWHLDNDLDTVALKKLLLQPLRRLPTFANASRTGHVCVLLPCLEEVEVSRWCSSRHWQLSSSLTTTHLVAVVALLNTLMALKGSSWTRSRSVCSVQSRSFSGTDSAQSGCSVAIAFHLVLLPSVLKSLSVGYAAPRLELLARRWQDGCVEVRQASQALLRRELTRIEEGGRLRLLESWAPFMPYLLDSSVSILSHSRPSPSSSTSSSTIAAPPIPPRGSTSPLPRPGAMKEEAGRDSAEVLGVKELRRNQATALVLLAVVGSEFGDELQKAELTRLTAQCLADLVLSPPSHILPTHSPLRRAAIDLIGRGFPQWEPHLDISKVLLGLLAIASSIPPNTSTQAAQGWEGGLPPVLDSQRTARVALSAIGRARSPALITALSTEVARFNSAAQHQTIQHTVSSPLLKSRTEVLRIIEELALSNYEQMVEMMAPLGEVLVHCLDSTLLKHKSLADIFPPITRFPMVGYCPGTRRIAFGAKNGLCVVHDIRAAKSQTLRAHQTPVTAVAFSEDGKFLATFAAQEANINFWQTSQSFLGMGQSTLKCVKSQVTPVTHGSGEQTTSRLVWISNRAISLLLPNGVEHRFAL